MSADAKKGISIKYVQKILLEGEEREKARQAMNPLADTEERQQSRSLMESIVRWLTAFWR